MSMTMTMASMLEDPSPTAAALGAFSAGTFLHIFIFRYGEWDNYTTKLLLTSGLIYTALYYVSSQHLNQTPWEAIKTTSLIWSMVVAGIYTSMLVYRGAFHRLRRFPGPLVAKFSNIYMTSLSVKKFHLYEEVQEMHNKYGDIVRVGPSTLSIADPRAVSLIHSNSSPCGKGPWYNILHPVVSLHMIRDKKEHAVRRKTWDKAFSSKALRDYEPRVIQYTDQLLRRIQDNVDTPLDVSRWFNFYSFDIMGDLAFGKSFDMLKDGIAHYFMTLSHTNMLLVSAFSHLVWMFPLFKETPGLNHEHIKFQKWLATQVATRRQTKPELPDVFSWILSDYDNLKSPKQQDYVNLQGDAHLIVVAGSDTTAVSLTCLFFELAVNKRARESLQAEIDQFYSEGKDIDHSSLAKLKYLQACIDESLRLHPPVPSGLQRMTPPEGLQIGETFVPGDTIVQIPTYTLYRDERVFARPEEYIPERWTTQKELTKDASIFAPFSSGRYSCVGKQLGLMELRFVTVEVLSRYDIALADENGAQVFIDGLKDGFTLASSGLRLVFTPRKAEAELSGSQ